MQYRISKVPAGREVRVLPEDSVLGVFPDTGALKLIGGSITLSGEGRLLPKMTVALDPRVAIAEALRSQIVVQPTNKDANVLMISYSGPDSQLVRDIPNAVARAFVRKRMELDRGGALQRMDYLRRQRATLSADVADAEAAMRAYLEKEGISGVAGTAASAVVAAAQPSRAPSAISRRSARTSRALRAAEQSRYAEGARSLPAEAADDRSVPAFGDRDGGSRHYKQLMQARTDMVARRVPTSREVVDLDKAIRQSQDAIRRSTETFLANLDQEILAVAASHRRPAELR